MPQTSIILTDEITQEIACRRKPGERTQSEAIRESLDRYFNLLKRSRAELRDLFTEGEISLLLDTANGVLYSADVIPSLWMGVEDTINLDGTDRKWGVDGAALVEKLKKLSPAQTFALVDSCERFWEAVSRGENPAHGEALK